MIRVSEICLEAGVIDTYQNSVYSLLPNVIMTAPMDRNAGRR